MKYSFSHNGREILYRSGCLLGRKKEKRVILQNVIIGGTKFDEGWAALWAVYYVNKSVHFHVCRLGTAPAGHKLYLGSAFQIWKCLLMCLHTSIRLGCTQYIISSLTLLNERAVMKKRSHNHRGLSLPRARGLQLGRWMYKILLEMDSGFLYQRLPFFVYKIWILLSPESVILLEIHSVQCRTKSNLLFSNNYCF